MVTYTGLRNNNSNAPSLPPSSSSFLASKQRSRRPDTIHTHICTRSLHGSCFFHSLAYWLVRREYVRGCPATGEMILAADADGRVRDDCGVDTACPVL